MSSGKKITIHWFRRGLRIHDNPSLLAALNGCDEFLPIFIFDGISVGTKMIGYNRMRFLLESLRDIDEQLRSVGGQLYIFKNSSPITVLQRIWQEMSVSKITFEQDCEPIWRSRDDAVKRMCQDSGIEFIEEVAHTLWNPYTVIKTNGGIPPLTYQMFLHTTSVIGPPPRPVENPNWSTIKFGKLPEYLAQELGAICGIPSPEDFGLTPEVDVERKICWIGGELQALKHLKERLAVEETAFKQGYFLPNQAKPDLLGPPTSQSAALTFGCLSVRKFYWSLHDLFNDVNGGYPPSNVVITGQLVWREFFYTMSVNNEHYGEMEKNPICINIPWKKTDDKGKLDKWKEGKTGYPFIDGAMRQLLQEGWIHHVSRNAVACFLTRGDLWFSWEEGLKHFLRYLLDADWSVCAGNWMWVSSSAFEQVLDCSLCVCPVNYGRRLDPWGEYIKRYVPELQNYPVEFLYEPWKAPIEVQRKAGCIIGKDYPQRIVDHHQASKKNQKYMQEIRDSLMQIPDHCCPSNEKEARHFMWLPDHSDHVCPAPN